MLEALHEIWDELGHKRWVAVLFLLISGFLFYVAFSSVITPLVNKASNPPDYYVAAFIFLTALSFLKGCQYTIRKTQKLKKLNLSKYQGRILHNEKSITVQVKRSKNYFLVQLWLILFSQPYVYISWLLCLTFASFSWLQFYGFHLTEVELSKKVAVIFSLGTIAIPLLCLWSANTVFRKQEEFFTLPTEFVFRDNGFNIKSDPYDKNYQWTQFGGWVRKFNSFILFTPNNFLCILPLKSFSDKDQIQKFTLLLKAKISMSPTRFSASGTLFSIKYKITIPGKQ